MPCKNDLNLDDHRCSQPPNVRITFELAPQSWHNSASETLWATQLTESTYRLENSPFYVYGASCGDVVEGSFVNGLLCAVRVVARGGHSTYRLILRPNKQHCFQETWRALEGLGCNYELGNGVYAVDVPASADIFAVYHVLEKGESENVWSFDEGHCGHPT